MFAFKFCHLNILLLLLKTGIFASENSNYPAYKSCIIQEKNLKYFSESCSPGAYLYPYILTHIEKKEVASILEIGSRDALDAIRLSEYFKCHVYAFECNPQCLEICRSNASQTPNITLVEKAIWDHSGMIPFFPIVPATGKITDPGCSSCFPLAEMNYSKYQQSRVTVSAIRLDDWLSLKKIQSVDLICMDTQGATLKILQSMGSSIKNTKYIVTECETEYHYKDECLLPELISFLHDQGFELIPTSMPWDYLFVNTKLIQISDLLDLAQRYFHAADYTLALKTFEQKVSLGGSNQEIALAHYYIGRCQEALGKPPYIFMKSYHLAFMQNPGLPVKIREQTNKDLVVCNKLE